MQKNSMYCHILENNLLYWQIINILNLHFSYLIQVPVFVWDEPSFKTNLR